MERLVDFAWYRRRSDCVEQIRHPAGPVLSLAAGQDDALVPQDLRARIADGRYCRTQIACLGKALRASDRVLDIGAGLGVTTAVAAARARCVVAIEADRRVLPLTRRLLDASGANEVELLHGLPAVGRKGRGPVFLRADFRRSSRSPGGGTWKVMDLAPFLPLNAIIADARISVIVCDIPFGAAMLLTAADLSGIDRILLTRQPDTVTARELDESLAVRGFFPDPQLSEGRVTLYRRLSTGRCARVQAGETVAITG